MKTGLLALIHPYTLTEFLSLYEKGEPFVVHHTDEHIDVLKHLPFLNSLEDLLKSWPHTIQAHLPDARDEISSVDTTTKDAQKLFDNGMGLLFNEAHTISPLLADWIEQIKLELGLSMMTYGRCLIYATPDGKGTAPHFDQNINFVLQIHGTKIWNMAKNEFVENPLTRHTIGQMPDPELMSYLHEPMPEKMPGTAKSYELKPGSLLFVPRGYWHATEAKGDALALNFTFTAPTWLDLFTAALRGRLAQSPEWRATADGVSSAERRGEAEAQFNHLLQDLVKDLPHWNAGDILEATDPFTT
jgi:50S ribosomal protein L16 3-hydroxylase